VGYAIGYRTGPHIFTREDSRWFSRTHLVRTREFYERHGGKTIVLARFIPIIRTFAPVVAGVGRMEYRRFLAYNVFGGIGWVVGLTWAGYLLGQTIPDIGRYIHVVIVVIIVLSVIPIGVEWWRARARRDDTVAGRR
jgi:membrane-associated protein